MPVSDEAISCSPTEISMNGTATCTSASTVSAPRRSRNPARASIFSAIGSSTSAASAVRRNTIIAGERSSRPSLMNRYDAPQKDESARNLTQERRLISFQDCKPGASAQMTIRLGFDKLCLCSTCAA